MSFLINSEDRAPTEPGTSLVPELQLAEDGHDKMGTPNLDSNVETKSPKDITLRSDQPEQEDDSSPHHKSLDKFILDRLKTVPFLKIPKIFGFERKYDTISHIQVQGLTADSTQVVYQTDKETFRSMEELHTHLLKQEIPIPLKFFTFENGILHQETFILRDDCVETRVKPDLSAGQEIIPIPVVWKKGETPGKLAKYLTKSFPADDLGVNLEHDDGFLVCCSCDDDCKNKLKCPCFLKTLDNCSQETRDTTGYESIGYRHQRLEEPLLSGIFECNRLCKCRKSTCMNRVAQNEIICPLQLFMTRMKGWGVRTLCAIPKGTFICTYVGKVVNASYANKVSKNWSSPEWKFLCVLKPGDPNKEGYEEKAIEPEVEKEERDQRNTSVSHNVSTRESTFKPPRVLRSFESLESAHLFENILSGMSGFIMESMEDKEYLCHLNTVSRRLQEKVKISSKRRKLASNQMSGPTVTNYMSKQNHDLVYNQANESRYVELKKKAEEQNEARQHLKVRHCLTPQFVRQKVLTALRLRGENRLEGNAGVTGNNKLTRLKRTVGQSIAGQKRAVPSPLDEKHPLLMFDLNIDGHKFGNIGRYLNHSCDPNIFPQCVFTNSHDLRLPVVAFFAARNIRPGEELTWNYNYERDPETKSWQIYACHCQSFNCTGRII